MAEEAWKESTKVEFIGKKNRHCQKCDILFPDRMAQKAEKPAKALREEGENCAALHELLCACPLCATKEMLNVMTFSESAENKR